MQSLDSLTEKLSYLDSDQSDEIVRAYYYAEKAHEGQVRRSGDPYITHPLAVCKILADMHMDSQSLMAALLHDVLEDTPISKETLASEFSDVIADLVDGVSKIGAIKFESRAEQQAENFRKMVLAMTEDIRVILVKLADRLHNMRTLGILHPQKRRRIATETLEIYAPIANRLGMNDFRMELEDLCFTNLYPMRASRIKKALKQAKGSRHDVVSQIQEAITNRLEHEGIQAHVIGREKHLFSIYEKMRTQRKSFDQIMDVYGFRIVVDSVDNCYRTLGAVHNLYKPIPGRFKDYVAIPKANGYQSLHTILKGMRGVPIEIQIRTDEMESMANNGIAAHWLYKSDDPAGGAQSRAKAWLKGLLEMQQRAGDSLEFIENVKIDLFPDEVYVFTPKGNILELPNGATPVDFAFAVHTDVGNSCVAARIDHRLVPLSTPILSGQTIRIITAPGACPNPAWLSFVTTAKARSNIRHFLKNQRHSESIELGQRLLEKALSAFNLSLDSVAPDTLQQILGESGFATLDDLLEDIGLGNQMAQITAHRLRPKQSEEENKPDPNSPTPLVIRGTEGMVISFSKCCRPIPGDSVVGHLSAGKGMVVHRDDCKNIATEMKSNPEKCVSVQWAKDVSGEYPVELRVDIENERGVLAMLASILSQADTNIENISLNEKDARLSVVILQIAVKDRAHLARTIRQIRKAKSVTKITRIRN